MLVGRDRSAKADNIERNGDQRVSTAMLQRFSRHRHVAEF